jgi:hypothetical protein
MIVVDGKELNLSVPIPDDHASDEEIARWNSLTNNERKVIRGIADIRKKSKYLKLIDPRKFNLQQILTKTPRHRFDCSGTRVNQDTGVREQWLLSNERPKIVRDNKVYTKQRISFWKEIEFNTENQSDLIYVLLNIVDVKQFGLIVENKEEEALKRISTRKYKAEVENWLFNKLSDKEVQKHAYRWGLNVKSLSVPELRVELFDAIELNELKTNKSRGFKTFLDEMNSDTDIVRIGSYFMDALQRKIVSFSKQRQCVYTDTGEVIGGIIPPERFKNDKEEYIIQYLVKDKTAQDYFLASLTNNEEVIEVNEDYMMFTHPAKLMSWVLKNYGVNIGRITIEEGRKKAAEIIENANAAKPMEEVIE